MVPLSAVARLEEQRGGQLVITRHGLSPSVNISFNLPAGVALGDALAQIEQERNAIGMPSSITGAPQGSAQAFRQSLATQPMLILAALVAVYIILGILYESFSTPLTILSTLPSAGLGAVVMLWLVGLDFSIMALVGVILLIGIVKKNGILMVDFALDAERRRRPFSGGGNTGSGDHPISADHHDDDSGPTCRDPTHACNRHGLRASAASRRRGGWRADCESGAHTVFDARRVPCTGPLAAAGPQAVSISAAAAPRRIAVSGALHSTRSG